RSVRPLLDAILRHPHLYDPDRRMVKPPVVQAAGMLRAAGRGIDTDAWSWLCAQAGQMLFEPPNVSGWDDTRWLDTATFRARWQIAGYAIRPRVLKETAKDVPGEAGKLADRAQSLLGRPTLTGQTEATLERFAKRALADANDRWK